MVYTLRLYRQTELLTYRCSIYISIQGSSWWSHIIVGIFFNPVYADSSSHSICYVQRLCECQNDIRCTVSCLSTPNFTDIILCTIYCWICSWLINIFIWEKSPIITEIIYLRTLYSITIIYRSILVARTGLPLTKHPYSSILKQIIGPTHSIVMTRKYRAITGVLNCWICLVWVQALFPSNNCITYNTSIYITSNSTHCWLLN